MANYKINNNVVTTEYDTDTKGHPICYGDCSIEGCPFELNGKCLSKDCIQSSATAMD